MAPRGQWLLAGALQEAVTGPDGGTGVEACPARKGERLDSREGAGHRRAQVPAALGARGKGLAETGHAGRKRLDKRGHPLPATLHELWAPPFHVSAPGRCASPTEQESACPPLLSGKMPGRAAESESRQACSFITSNGEDAGRGSRRQGLYLDGFPGKARLSCDVFPRSSEPLRPDRESPPSRASLLRNAVDAEKPRP